MRVLVPALSLCLTVSSALAAPRNGKPAAPSAAKRATPKRSSTRTPRAAKSLAKAPDASEAKPRSLADRQRIAIDTVQNALAPWVPKNQTLKVRASLVPFVGDQKKPITGDGPVEVYANQYLAPEAGPLKRFWHTFNNPYSKRLFTVSVPDDGEASVLSMQSNATKFRFGRFLDRWIPVRNLTRDFLASPKAAEGIATAVATGAIATVSLPIAVGTGVHLVRTISDGLKHERDARTSAMNATATWAKAESKKAWPSLGDTYRYYKLHLGDKSPGTRPFSLSRFADQLAVRGL
jgi:hypothetical protein